MDRVFRRGAVTSVLRLILMHAEGASRRAPHERRIREQQTQEGGEEAALHKGVT
jgi:hypothetical protein